MKNKLLFLTKTSLNKKIKTKWFLIANLLFAIIIIGLINIDSIIQIFGGDFDSKQEIYIIDECNAYDIFKNYYTENSKNLPDYIDTEILNYNQTYEEGLKLIEKDDNKILLIISPSEDNYIKAKIISNNGIGNTTNTLINTSLKNVRSRIVLTNYNISYEEYQNISKNVLIDNVVLSNENKNNNLITSSIMQIIMLPIFMLIIFLVQMIGAEVNEEKTTKSMEIIISNVSPKVHFLSKIISSNLFVIIQGALLIIFTIIGTLIRFITSKGNIIGNLTGDMESFVSTIQLNGVADTITFMLPIIIIMLLLTFIAYSLLAGILASMTTNLEDFQQLQTPIVIVSLVGYYLSMMTTVFSGSTFIKIMSYIPFISSMLSPTLYVLGEINLIDLLISISLLIGTIYILIKYGIRIYKVGILNYSQNDLFKRMFKAVREEKWQDQ